MLSSISPYCGNTKILVGNSKHLKIAHIGSALLKTIAKPLTLNDVLYVLDLSHHLLSMQKLCADKNCVAEFDSSFSLSLS